MSIPTSGAAAGRGGMLARIRDWLEASERRPASRGEITPLEHLNDHLLRDIGVHPHPSRAQRRLLMRL